MIVDIENKGALNLVLDRAYGKRTDGLGPEDGDVFHVEFDPGEDHVPSVVVRAVGAIRDCHPLELEPLANSIDPETLEGMVEQRPTGSRHSGEITFHYEGFVITVDVGGDIWLERV